jgi:flavin-binding protein dodecin
LKWFITVLLRACWAALTGEATGCGEGCHCGAGKHDPILTSIAGFVKNLRHNKRLAASVGHGGPTMSIGKVVEISSSSKKSFEDAIHSGIERASKTVRGISGAWIKEQKVLVKNGKVVEYRVNMSVTFLLDDRD